MAVSIVAYYHPWALLHWIHERQTNPAQPLQQYPHQQQPGPVHGSMSSSEPPLLSAAPPTQQCSDKKPYMLHESMNGNQTLQYPQQQPHLVHGSMNSRDFHALLSQQQRQELHVMPRGRKHQRGRLLRQALT